MSGELIPYADINERQTRGAIGITAVTRLKHADLFAAAKKFERPRDAKNARPGPYGGQAAMARKLKMCQAELGRWINLRGCPPAEPRGKWTARRLMQLEAKLLKMTGKSLEELFPAELRANIQFLAAPKQFERTVVIEQTALAHYAEATRARLELAQKPNSRLTSDEIKERVEAVLNSFTPKQRTVIEYRYGLHDSPQLTYEEIGKMLGLQKERIRQIEAKVLREIRSDIANGKCDNLREIIDADFEVTN